MKKNNYKILFTPPYSPNLNPIENTFGIIKKIYKNELQLKNYNTTNIINDIEGSILIFEDIHKNNLKSICSRALKFSYNDIEKEIRDRFIIKDDINFDNLSQYYKSVFLKMIQLKS